MRRLLALLIFAIMLTSPMAHSESKSNRVPIVHTPIGQLELAQVLKNSHYSVFGEFPSDKRLAVAWAQVAIENGQGYQTFNHNLGNINSAKSRPYYLKHHRFKSHKDFIDGGIDYWKIVHKMCRSSLPAFDAGAPRWAANRLSACGYYGADKTKYGHAMAWLYTKAKTKLIPQL